MRPQYFGLFSVTSQYGSNGSARPGFTASAATWCGTPHQGRSGLGAPAAAARIARRGYERTCRYTATRVLCRSGLVLRAASDCVEQSRTGRHDDVSAVRRRFLDAHVVPDLHRSRHEGTYSGLTQTSGNQNRTGGRAPVGRQQGTPHPKYVSRPEPGLILPEARPAEMVAAV